MDTGENTTSLVSEPSYHLAACSFFFFFACTDFIVWQYCSVPTAKNCLCWVQSSVWSGLVLASTFQFSTWKTFSCIPTLRINRYQRALRDAPGSSLCGSLVPPYWVPTREEPKSTGTSFSPLRALAQIYRNQPNLWNWKLEIGFVLCPLAKRWTTNCSSVQSNSSHDEWLVIGFMHFI